MGTGGAGLGGALGLLGVVWGQEGVGVILYYSISQHPHSVGRMLYGLPSPGWGSRFSTAASQVL